MAIRRIHDTYFMETIECCEAGRQQPIERRVPPDSGWGLEEEKEWHINIGEETDNYLLIAFCPWCGQEVPE